MKVHFKGKDDDFLVFVDDEQALKKWKAGDTSVPLTQVIGSFQVFITHR